jgi:putative Ca2+/H+ antiporter (TMEM165/GDT1 family)
MDLKLLLTTFGMIFLAELGDKTQLATFFLSANYDSKISIFIGSAGALVVCSLIAVFFGAEISKFIPQNYIKIGSGVFFIAVGVWILFSAIRTI